MTTLNCEDVIQVLYAYLDGELTPQSKSEIDEHIHQCRECMGRTQFEQLLRERVRETAQVPAPEALRSKLLSLLDDD